MTTRHPKETTMSRAIAYLKKVRLRHLRKALAAGLGAGGVVLGKSLLDLHVDHAEAGLIASATVGAFVVTFFAKSNADIDDTVDPAPDQD